MPKSLQLSWIQERVKKNEYLYTLHADEERRNEGFSIAEVEEALLSGQILIIPTTPVVPRAWSMGTLEDGRFMWYAGGTVRGGSC